MSNNEEKIQKFGVLNIGESQFLYTHQLDIANGIICFLSNSFNKMYSDYPNKEFELFANMVKSKFSEAILGTHIFYDMKHENKLIKGRTHEDFHIQSWRSFCKDYKELAISYRGASTSDEINIPSDIIPQGDVYDDIVEGEGLIICQEPFKKNNDLNFAWDMAKYNLMLAASRIICFTLLDNMIRDKNITGREENHKKELEVVRNYFYNRYDTMKLRLYEVGVLMGDEIKDQLSDISRRTYGQGRFIMHLMSVDGKHFGSYLIKDENDLRNSINRSVKNLKNKEKEDVNYDNSDHTKFEP